MVLKELTIVKDKRSNCLSCMGVTTIKEYISYINAEFNLQMQQNSD